jgi:2-hydroxycyclohexanecarboxyl-CoA dehydrogenase
MTRVAVVTGGASGIGEACCRQLAEAGRKVAVLDWSGDAAEGVAEQLRSKGATAMAATVDVSDRAAVDAAYEQVRAELGPIEILVTSAGITGSDPFHEMPLETWDRILSVNLTGTFHSIQAAIGDMRAGGWGRVVTISSSSAQQGSPQMAHYVASKGGVIGLTKSLAREYAPEGITVNTIPPSTISTPMLQSFVRAGRIPSEEESAKRIPVGRMGTPDDIAAACVFLCSEAASYITGQIIGVNGGSVIA